MGAGRGGWRGRGLPVEGVDRACGGVCLYAAGEVKHFLEHAIGISRPRPLFMIQLNSVKRRHRFVPADAVDVDGLRIPTRLYLESEQPIEPRSIGLRRV